MKFSLDTKIINPENDKINKAIVLLHGYGGDANDISAVTLNWKRFFQKVKNHVKYLSGLSKDNYTVEPIETKAALNIVIENHYLHRAAPCSKAYGIFEKGGFFGGTLKGVVCYGVPAYNPILKSICGEEEADNVYENERLKEILTLGKKFGNKDLNITDGAKIPNLRGSYEFDDEGTPATKTPLIREGILTGRLHSNETANKMSEEATGNARAISFAFPPIV